MIITPGVTVVPPVWEVEPLPCSSHILVLSTRVVNLWPPTPGSWIHFWCAGCTQWLLLRFQTMRPPPPWRPPTVWAKLPGLLSVLSHSVQAARLIRSGWDGANSSGLPCPVQSVPWFSGWRTSHPQPPVMSVLTLSVVCPSFPAVLLKGPGHSDPFWQSWGTLSLRHHCRQSLAALESAWSGPLGMETDGLRPQRGSKARTGAGPHKYVPGEHPRHLIPYGSITTILCLPRKRRDYKPEGMGSGTTCHLCTVLGWLQTRLLARFRGACSLVLLVGEPTSLWITLFLFGGVFSGGGR